MNTPPHPGSPYQPGRPPWASGVAHPSGPPARPAAPGDPTVAWPPPSWGGRAPVPEPAKPRRRRGRWIAAALAVVVLAGAAGGVALWRFGYLDRYLTRTAEQPPPVPVLDVQQVQEGVALILGDPAYGYGANEVETVSCNGGVNPPVVPGTEFTCQVDIDGAERQVQVLIRSEDGAYEVDGPR